MLDLGFLTEDDLDTVQVVSTAKTLAKQGVVLSLHIGRWTATAKPTLDELGFGDLSNDEKKKLTHVWNIGRFQLLPRTYHDALSRLQQAGYENRNKHCFRIESLGIDFLPATAYQSWKARNEQLRAEFMALVQTLVDKWPDIVEQRMEAFQENAATIYRKNGLTEADVPFETWRLNYLVALRTKYPPRDAVQSRFYWRHTLTHLPIAFDQPTGAAGMLGEIQDEVASQHNSVLAEFLSEIQGQFYGTVHRMVQNIQDKIKKHGYIPGPSTKAIRNLVENIKGLNVFEDQVLEDRMAALRNVLDLAASKNESASLDDISRELASIEDLVKVQLIATDRVSRYAREDAVDVPEDMLVDVERKQKHVEEVDIPTVGEVSRKPRVAPTEAEPQQLEVQI